MADKNKAYIVEKLGNNNQLYIDRYTTSVRQLYLYLDGRFRQAKKKMPCTQSALTKRIAKWEFSSPVWLWENENFRVTKVEEYRKRK